MPTIPDDAPGAQPPRPEVRKAEYTFDVVGPCIYCGKTAKRLRTFQAKSLNDAYAQADAAASGLCHRKCGGY